MHEYRNNLGPDERKTFDKARHVFEDLLVDFEGRHLLRKGTHQDQRERLQKMWRQSRLFGEAFNTTIHLFYDVAKLEAFANRNREDGFTERIIADSLLNQYIGLFIYNIETVFKTSLLFFLKEEQGLEKRMALGKLLATIEDISPPIGVRLEEMVDRELRNALAHGGIWFGDGDKVFLARNSHLENPKEITLYEFMIRVKRQNIVSHAFIEVLMEKVRQGYFRG